MRAQTWLIVLASLIALASATGIAIGGQFLFRGPYPAACLGALCASATLFACWAAFPSRIARQHSSRVETELPRLLLDEIPGLVSTLSPDGLIEFVNRQTLEFYGRPLAQMRDWTLLIHADDRPAFLQGWHDAFTTGRALNVEFRTERADGSFRWMSSRISPLRDSHGHISRWCNLLTDIDESKRAEEALRLSEHQLRLIIDNIPGFAYTLTPQGEIEQVE